MSLPDRLPASLLQESWLRATPGRVSNHNLAVGWRLLGPLDTKMLEHAIAEVTARHETLRTTFAGSGSDGEQLIWPPRPARLVQRDLTGPRWRDRRRLWRLMVEENRTAFTLTERDLMRTTLFKLGEREHLLIVTLHHGIADGWSTRVVLRDVQRAYAAAAQGQPPRWSDLEIQFADYAVWERGLRNPDAEAYWRARLTDRPVLNVPQQPESDERNPFVSGPIGTATPAMVRRIAGLAKVHRTSLTIGLQAAVATALSPWAGDQIVLALIRANRTRPEVQPIVGPLADYCPVCVDLTGAPTFSDLIVRFRDASREALEHGLPIGALLRVLEEHAGAEVGPPCEMTVNYMPFAGVTGTIPQRRGDLRLVEVAIPLSSVAIMFERIPRHSPLLSCHFSGLATGPVTGSLGWHTTRVSHGTGQTVAQAIAHALRWVSRYPERPIRERPAVAEPELTLD